MLQYRIKEQPLPTSATAVAGPPATLWDGLVSCGATPRADSSGNKSNEGRRWHQIQTWPLNFLRACVSKPWTPTRRKFMVTAQDTAPACHQKGPSIGSSRAMPVRLGTAKDNDSPQSFHWSWCCAGLEKINKAQWFHFLFAWSWGSIHTPDPGYLYILESIIWRLCSLHQNPLRSEKSKLCMTKLAWDNKNLSKL